MAIHLAKEQLGGGVERKIRIESPPGLISKKDILSIIEPIKTSEFVLERDPKNGKLVTLSRDVNDKRAVLVRGYDLEEADLDSCCYKEDPSKFKRHLASFRQFYDRILTEARL